MLLRIADLNSYFHISTEYGKTGLCLKNFQIQGPPTAPLALVWRPQCMKLRLQVANDQFHGCSFHETVFLKGNPQFMFVIDQLCDSRLGSGSKLAE